MSVTSRARSDQQVGTQTAEVAGEPVAYESYGDPGGEPVVFLHGTPGSRVLGELYDDAARARGVRVLAFDRPGYGQSPARDGYGPADTGDVVAAVLDDAGVESAGLLGFSGGAPHALAAATDLGDRVTRVDVVAGGVPASEREETPTPQRVLGTLAGATPRVLGGLLRGQAWLAARRPPAFVTAQYTTDGARDGVPDEVADVVKRDFLEALSERRAGVVRESRQFTEDWPTRPRDVDCEVRWFHGERDTNVPVAAARRTADALPDCDFRALADTDHLGALVESRGAVLDAHAPEP
ncbi:alpha/beta fold hydrolase [Halobacterium litoreum]|uniref:Alpha/beta fold hydrolase n=1 Tax=Halobacterium litoreum TaxID=2039234 RepID=A0ABD5NFL9_9EURY|nr:alpha/beta hydrolase [Halobacterium litoreum]UHH13279.1 alpha/beta hydrolase [Halobacterium litoreum]